MSAATSGLIDRRRKLPRISLPLMRATIIAIAGTRATLCGAETQRGHHEGLCALRRLLACRCGI
jgi:hypothetical protein